MFLRVNIYSTSDGDNLGLQSTKEKTPKMLISSDGTLLSFPNIKVKATLGERAFVFAAPKLWNALPRFTRETKSIDSFKRQLKTYLFEKAFRTT